MLNTFRFNASKAIVAIFLAVGLLALPNPISGTPQAKAVDAAPVFDNSNPQFVYVMSDGNYVWLHQASGLTNLSSVAPDTSRFTVMVGGQANVVRSAGIVQNWVVQLGVTNRIPQGATVTVSYTDAGNTTAIQTNTGVKALPFGPLTVRNDSTFIQTVPNAPGVSTVVAGEEQATITVIPPTGGPTPTSYVVTASPGGRTCTVTGASGSCTVTGLTAGVAYTFTTVARTASGSSPSGSASVPTTALARTAPNTPGAASVAAGEEQATITVTAPTGGPTPTSYVVTASPGGNTCTVNGASGSCTVTGLTAGVAYTFTTVARLSTGNSPAGAASRAVTVLARTVAPVTTGSNGPSWDREPATDSETDAFTQGYWPSAIPGNIIITDEFGFTVDKKNGIKPKIRMKNYSGIIKMSISATYKDGSKTKKFKCTFAPFGSAKKMKTAKWKWYTPKKACVLPKPLVTAIQTGKATLSAKGKWTRQWVTSGKKARPDKTKIKARTLKYTVRAKPAGV